MAKLIFLLRRKSGTTREQCLSDWSSGLPTSLVEKLPGLEKWLQNAVTGGPGSADCDGVGEMWFASDEAMTKALYSPEMAQVLENSKIFLDMDRTSIVTVSETAVIG